MAKSSPNFLSECTVVCIYAQANGNCQSGEEKDQKKDEGYRIKLWAAKQDKDVEGRQKKKKSGISAELAIKSCTIYYSQTWKYNCW